MIEGDGVCDGLLQLVYKTIYDNESISHAPVFISPQERDFAKIIKKIKCLQLMSLP